MRGGGLLRVSESVLQNDIPLDGLTTDGVRALSAAADGSVWVATEHNLHHFSGSARKVYSLSQTLALHTDPSGTVWAATTQDVVRVVGDRRAAGRAAARAAARQHRVDHHRRGRRVSGSATSISRA